MEEEGGEGVAGEFRRNRGGAEGGREQRKRGRGRKGGGIAPWLLGR